MATKNPLLKNIKKALSKRYAIDWEDGNVIGIQLEPHTAVIAFFLVDPERQGVIFSCALDFPDPFVTADLVIEASNHAKVLLGEGFFVSQNKAILWGADAYKQMHFEMQPSFLLNAATHNKLLN